MLIAKLTAKGTMVSLALILLVSAGAAAVGVALHTQVPREEGAPFPRAAADDWSWVDQLSTADAATRQRLKLCARSAERNFAALRKLSFDFHLTREIAVPNPSGKFAFLTHTYMGKVCWNEGAVRYDFEGDSPSIQLDPHGQPKKGDKGSYSVIRTRDMVAGIEDNVLYGTFLKVAAPPESYQAWQQTPFFLTHLDPWLHYAPYLRTGRVTLSDFCKACRLIESEEDGNRVLLRFRRGDNHARVEMTCDKSVDDLPVRFRDGEERGNEFVVWTEETNDWTKTDGVWYPTHHVKTAYVGLERKPVKEYDLEVSNLRANGSAKVSDAVFTLSDMAMPDGAVGIDTRKSPPTNLIRANGVVRERRMTEKMIPKSLRPAAAPTTTSATPGRGPKEGYVTLLAEFEVARQSVEKAFVGAKTEDEQRAAFEALPRLEADYAGRFLEVAAGHPRDPVAIDALAGVLVNRFTPRESKRAAEVLIRDHLRSDALVLIYEQLSTPPLALSQAAETLLRAGMEKAPSPEARAQACLSLAYHLKNRAEALRGLKGPEPDPFLRITARLNGLESLDGSLIGDPDRLMREAESLFDRVVERYAEIPGERGTLGDAARTELFRLRELAVGKVAPVVEGPDVDGKSFALNEYRGKVVVLTFSGNWCPPCRAMYPHERSLVERMKGRPFALLCVNTDPDQETLRSSLRSGEITWRCWWEGGSNRPNCERWKVEQFPSIYVLDGEGVIRARDVRGKALEEAVDRLMTENEGKGKPEP